MDPSFINVWLAVDDSNTHSLVASSITPVSSALLCISPHLLWWKVYISQIMPHYHPTPSQIHAANYHLPHFSLWQYCVYSFGSIDELSPLQHEHPTSTSILTNPYSNLSLPSLKILQHCVYPFVSFDVLSPLLHSNTDIQPTPAPSQTHTVIYHFHHLSLLQYSVYSFNYTDEYFPPQQPYPTTSQHFHTPIQ